MFRFLSDCLIGITISACSILLLDRVVIGNLPIPPLLGGTPVGLGDESPSPFRRLALASSSPLRDLSPAEMQQRLIPLRNGVDRLFLDVDTEWRIERERLTYLDPILGIMNRPLATARHQLRRGNRLIFDVTYHTDQFGRRVTPVSEPQNGADKFLAFLGCSMTFGNGLPDDETLPSLAGKEMPGFVPYNYGVGGSSPAYALALLENHDLRKEIPQKSGIGIFMFMDEHLDRTIGNSFWSASSPSTPDYEMRDDGGVVREGTFASTHPIRTYFYGLYSRSNFARKTGLMLPPYVSRSHLKFMCSMFKKMNSEFLRQFPEGRFYVGFMPNASRDFDFYSACLKEGNVPYLDLRKFTHGYANVPWAIEFDGHPTKQRNQAAASAIAELLQAR